MQDTAECRGRIEHTCYPFRASTWNITISLHLVSAKPESAASCHVDCDRLSIQEVAFLTSVLRDQQEQCSCALRLVLQSEIPCRSRDSSRSTVLSTTSPGHPTLSSLVRGICNGNVLLQDISRHDQLVHPEIISSWSSIFGQIPRQRKPQNFVH